MVVLLTLVAALNKALLGTSTQYRHGEYGRSRLPHEGPYTAVRSSTISVGVLTYVYIGVDVRTIVYGTLIRWLAVTSVDSLHFAQGITRFGETKRFKAISEFLSFRQVE